MLTTAQIDRIIEKEIEDHIKWVTVDKKLTERELQIARAFGRTVAGRSMRECGFLKKIEEAEDRALTREVEADDRRHRAACKSLGIPY